MILTILIQYQRLTDRQTERYTDKKLPYRALHSFGMRTRDRNKTKSTENPLCVYLLRCR